MVDIVGCQKSQFNDWKLLTSNHYFWSCIRKSDYLGKYRVTHLVGENLPLAQFRQLVGR